MSGRLSAVTLREVGGDPEELRALQTVMERDEHFALRITRHPPGLAEDGFAETGQVRPWRNDKLRSGAILMDKPVAARHGPA